MMKRGFTLAEVLVTLLVIGVIAALTIPQLINSTEDRQFKTAYKKAVSSIANATELMEANEISCSVSNDSDLAKCMKNAIKGTVTNANGEPDEEGNVLVTQDGMAFMFFLPWIYKGNIESLQGENENYAAPKRAISKICPNFNWEPTNYFDFNSQDTATSCYVFVDLDGLGKNSSFAGVGMDSDDFKYYFIDNPVNFPDIVKSGDIQIFGFTGKGEVRPVYINSNEDLEANNGYRYMYGEETLEKLKENYQPHRNPDVEYIQ
ncbi:MAG: type II secretion system GspH family protein [bacterium]|nr:type II secretion system GspH family protein [bacterium]